MAEDAEKQPSEVEAAEVEKPQEQPFTEAQEARMQQLVADAQAKAFDEGLRKGQSTKDKEVAAERRKAREHEESLQSLRGRFKELDPDAAQALDVADKDAQLRAYRQREAEESQQRQTVEFDSAFHGHFAQHLKDLEIDPDDKRIDWGADAPDYLSRQDRILKSLSKIEKENRKSWEEKQKQLVKDEVAQLRKDAGFESVDTTGPSGVPGLTTLTRDGLEARMLKPDGLEWFRKNEGRIDELMREGKIK